MSWFKKKEVHNWVRVMKEPDPIPVLPPVELTKVGFPEEVKPEPIKPIQPETPEPIAVAQEVKPEPIEESLKPFVEKHPIYKKDRILYTTNRIRFTLMINQRIRDYLASKHNSSKFVRGLIYASLKKDKDDPAQSQIDIDASDTMEEEE
jgi:hypothetical protein